MNYLSVDNISKRIGERVLFEGVSFGIEQGQKTALVAKNGAGKTTMLKMLAGIDKPDTGEVAIQKNITVSFLPQVPELDDSLTVLEEIYQADNPTMQALLGYESALTLAEDGSDAHLNLLQDAAAKMDDLKAWDFEAEVKKVLYQLNITNLAQEVSQLSGGQRKRVALAKVIVQRPDLIILDEPTNHLDVEMIEWLEEYLSRSNVSMLLVTHDRYFLDRICTHIIELDHGQAFKYEGNYERFLQEKEKRMADHAASVEKAQNLYRKELEWMRRMPKARSTKAKYRIDNFYDIEKTAKSGRQEKELKLDIQMSRLGSKILEMHHVKKRFDDLVILEDFNYVFKKKERIGIVGRNGVGKSTFLNMIMGIEPNDQGKIETGETIIFGYYHQQGLQLEEDKRVIEVVKEIAEVIPVGKKGEHITASQFLTRFQFPPESQYTYVSQLSGGERRRLHLLTILVKNPNFLILDEPTNDLDLATLQTLEEFLDDYPGCLIIVSHDRYFMDRLAEHLFIFEGEGRIKDFNGKYTEYREWKKEQELEAKQAQKELKDKPKPVVVAKVVEAPQEKTRKLSFKEQREYEMLEAEIAALEEEKAGLEAKMNAGKGDYEELQAWAARISELIKIIDQKSERWLTLSEHAS